MDEKWEDIELYKFGRVNEFFYFEVRSFCWMYDKWKEER